MDSSIIAAVGSPRPPTIASRRPMLSSQRSLSALSINTSTTHADMLRRNSSASTPSKHRRLQTPTSVPPLPLSANSNSIMSPEELSSKIADSFQQFSSMLSQLSNNKSASNTALAPVTPPLIHNRSPSTNLNHISNNIPIQTEKQLLSHKLPSPPLINFGRTMITSPTEISTLNNNREVLRPTTNNDLITFTSSQNYDINMIENDPLKKVSSLNSSSDDETESDDDINFEEYNGRAIYLEDVLSIIGIPATAINEGNTRLRQRLISKWFTRAASVGDINTMQKMLNSITNIDVNCTDDKKTGITALMYAAYFGQVDCISLLLEQPLILVNQQDKKGWTALMWAINGYQMEVVQILLSNGAEKNLETHHGRTIFDYPTSIKVKELIGSPPLSNTSAVQKEGGSTTIKNVLVPRSNTSETECKFNGNSSVTVNVDYYQTAVNGYGHFGSGTGHGANIDFRKKKGTFNATKSNVYPPDFSQLTKATTSPQQEQRNKEKNSSNQTAASNDIAVEDEDQKRWEASIKSSNTFSWSQCLPDQMFVFSQDDLHLILDQALNVTDAKSLMNISQSSNELWRPANIIFLSARYAHYCSNRELLHTLLGTVNAKLSRIIKTNYRDLYSLAYWIANICQLSSYLKKDSGLFVSTSEAQENLSALISEAYSAFVAESQKKIERILEPAMMDFESIQELEQVDFVDDWQRFFRRSSTNHGRKSTDTICSLDRRLSVDPTNCNSIHPSTILSDNTSSSTMSPQSVTSLLTTIQSILQAYYIPPAIVIQAMAQFFHYLSCELFNRVLTYKKYICRSRALQLRMNLSTMEEWVRTYQLPSSLNNAFEPFIQLLQLLQCLSQMDNIILFSSTVQTFDKLNPLQVRRCVQNYRYEVSEHRLPDDVEEFASQMAQEYQQQRLILSSNRKNSCGGNVIKTRASMDSFEGKSNFISAIGSRGAGRPASITSLNCLLSTTANKKRLSAEELSILNNNTVQQLDNEEDDNDDSSEKRNSKYVLPFSIPITTALLQDWTEEKHKKSVCGMSDSNNYSDAIYKEIKLKKLEQLNLLDRIYPTIPEEWLYHLDKRLYTK